MSSLRILLDSDSAISLPESADGATPCDLPNGWTTDRSGPEAVHASRSAQPESSEEKRTRGISGPLFGDLSGSADLQSSLESRLRQILDTNGSPEYALTWRTRDIGLGPRICALRAAVRRTSGSDCGGWPTPNTPTGGPNLESTAAHRGGMDLDGAVLLAGWGTPRATDGSKGGPNQDDVSALPRQAAQLAGWPTATSRDYKDGASEGTVPNNGLLGRVVWEAIGTTASGIHAETGRRGASRLNPRFSLWLMGYPAEWACCGALAMQSFRRSQRSSSEPIAKQPEAANE